MLLNSTTEVIGRWKEYFADLFNPTSVSFMGEAELGNLGVGLSITEAEVAKLVKKFCGCRALGVDEIHPEFLKTRDVDGCFG